MTTLLAAQARLAQAIAQREAVERTLLAVMVSIDAKLAVIMGDGVLPRRFEAMLEGIDPHVELTAAYGAYRRAQCSERKARSAAQEARWISSPSPTTEPASRPRKRRKVKAAEYLRERLADQTMVA